MSFLIRLAGTAVLATAALPLHAETWRLSSMMTPDSFEGQTYQRFADLVEEYTEGEIEVRIYPNEQIGSMDSVVEQLSQGVIQLAPSAISFMSRWEEGINYAVAPFLFDDYDHWANFINGELFQSWLGTVEEEANITILGSIPDMPRGSFRTLLSTEPVETAADIEGLKLRQYQNDLIIDAWTYLGAEVRVLPWGEVYDGLNRGIVDAVTAPAESIESMRFYEVAPNIIRTDEYPQAVSWMMNQNAWEGLSTEQCAGAAENRHVAQRDQQSGRRFAERGRKADHHRDQHKDHRRVVDEARGEQGHAQDHPQRETGAFLRLADHQIRDRFEHPCAYQRAGQHEHRCDGQRRWIGEDGKELVRRDVAEGHE